MGIDQTLVTLGGIAFIAGIIWFFWGPRGEGVNAAVTASGFQEAMVLVKGGYTPDVIVVEHGRPVRLTFQREETASCSEMVIFEDFGKSAHLPTGEAVAILNTERMSCDTTTLVTFSSRWSFMISRVIVPVVSGSSPDVGSS